MTSNTMQSLDIIKDIYNIDQLLVGEAYIKELVHRLARILKVKYVMVGHATEPERDGIRSDYFWSKDHFAENVTYELDSTPCADVLCGTRVKTYTIDVQNRFPKDIMLQDLNIQSYMGAPFLDPDGSLIGLLVIMDDQPFENLDVQSAVVEFFAARIGAEYRRLAAEESQKRLNEKLEHLVQERTSALQEALASIQQTQHQLISQEKLATIGRITLGIAHELRNPLNFIINFAELLHDGDLDLEAQKQAVEMIRHHGHRANDVITDMLKQARHEPPQAPELIDISEMIERILDMYLKSITDLDLKSRLKQTVSITPNIKVLLTDSSGIERVLINIIDNALYALAGKYRKNTNSYTPELEVELTSSPGICKITIKDNGVGIPAKHLPNVCEEFYTTKPAGEGTGLGLWIAKQNIEKNRGLFKIQSKENEFTLISIEIPTSA